MKTIILGTVLCCIMTGCIAFGLGQHTERKRVNAILVSHMTETSDNSDALNRNTDSALWARTHTDWEYANNRFNGEKSRIAKISKEVHNP